MNKLKGKNNNYRKTVCGWAGLYLLSLFLLINGFSGTLNCYAQNSPDQIVLKGKVISEEDGNPVPSVSIKVEKSQIGTSADRNGEFTLILPKAETRILFQAMGFENYILEWTPDQTEIVINLTIKSNEIEMVTLNRRYSNRNNPAVDLILKASVNRALNNPKNKEFWKYELYDKKLMAASDLPKGLENGLLTRSISYIFENTDSTLSPGRTLLPIYLEEKKTEEFKRYKGINKKTRLLHHIQTELDPAIINNDNIQTTVQYLYKEIDVFENDLMVFNRGFLSPIANNAPVFYKYYIVDTVYSKGIPFVRLNFEPRNSKDKLFKGEIWISLDGKYAPRFLDLKIDGGINLNWVNDAHLKITFLRTDNGDYFPEEQIMETNFGVLSSRQGLFSQWTQVYTNHSTEEIPSTVFRGPPVEKVMANENLNHQDYNQYERPVPLSELEKNTYLNFDKLNKDPKFHKLLSWGSLLFTSYKKVGGVDIGKMEYFYSFNPVEGNRFRFGGRTNLDFSKKTYAEGYLAYGTKDGNYKGHLSVATSLNGQQIGSYPAHYLQFTYKNDIREPGQKLGFLNGDSFFRSFRSKGNNFWYNHEYFEIQHVYELRNHFRLQSLVTQKQLKALGNLKFTKAATGEDIPHLNTFELGFNLRWAPGEEFFQKNIQRSPIQNQNPIFNLRFSQGLKGVLNGEHEYSTIKLDIAKKVMLSQLGYAHLHVGGGYLHGKLPFPLLETPITNTSYVIEQGSYNMMKSLEFLSDQYVKFSIEHQMEGFILNKIPLIKKLKLREYWTYKMYYGRLRSENNPFRNSEMFLFPVDEEQNPVSFTFQGTPYMEGSAGIENIFNVLRVEYVRRFTHLHHPDVRREGWRFSIVLGF